MGKIYTLDPDLLNGRSEIRIGDKLYPVDDRLATVEEITALQKKADGEDIKLMTDAVHLALGDKAFKALKMEAMPFAACQKLLSLIMAAITGQEPEEIEGRFPEEATD